MASRREVLRAVALAWIPLPAAEAAAARLLEGESDLEREVEGLLGAVRARYGHHGFTPEELDLLRTQLRLAIRFGEQLRALALTHADEPATTFTAVPPSGGSDSGTP